SATSLLSLHDALPICELSQELRTVAHFEQAVKMLTEEDIAKEMTLGPDPQRYVDILQQYIDAGYTHVYVHQVGDNQEAFIRFFRSEEHTSELQSRENL